MKLTINLLLFISLLLNLFPAAAKERQQIIHLDPSLMNNTCLVFFWIEKNGKRQRIEYKSNPKAYNEKLNCLVKIPAKEFESYFSHCALAGISNISSPEHSASPEFNVSFAGGSHHPDKEYYFEWKDARNIHPRYSCLSK